MYTAALVLAAGSSSRLGESKQLLDWGGRPLLEYVVARVSQWPVDEVWVVLGHEADEVMDACDLGEANVVINDDHADGLASSLSVGLDALMQDGKAERAVIALGDQPTIDPDVVAELLERHALSHRLAAIPRYRYTRSNPVAVDRTLFTRLMSLEGDQGARQLLQAHPDWVEEVLFEQMPPRDVDTRTDVVEMRPRSPR